VYCGYCQFFGCEMGAKASPQTAVLPNLMQQKNFELRTHANVTRVNLDARRKRAIGVTYVDSRGREFEQPAEMVLLCSYVLNNVRLMLLSGIGKPYDPAANTGVVGRNYAYQTPSSVTLFFEDRVFNQFMAAGGMGMTIDEFNGDNFDHSGLGFIGGGFFPGGDQRLAADRGAAGAARHAALGRRNGSGGGDLLQPLFPITIQGACQSYRGNYLDLDPTYRDAYGLPLLRMTFDRRENEHKNVAVAHRQGGTDRQGHRPVEDERRPAHREVHHRPYQSTHKHGGAIMEPTPRPAPVNRYLQSWAVRTSSWSARARFRRTAATTRRGPSAPHLLGAGCDQEPLPEVSRLARRLALSRRNTRPARWCPSAAGRGDPAVLGAA